MLVVPRISNSFGTTPTPMHALVDTATLKGRLALSAFDAVRGLRDRKNEAAALLRPLRDRLRQVFAKTAVAIMLAGPVAEFAGLV